MRRVVLYKAPLTTEVYTSVKILIECHPELGKHRISIYYHLGKSKKTPTFTLNKISVERVELIGTITAKEPKGIQSGSNKIINPVRTPSKSSSSIPVQQQEPTKKEYLRRLKQQKWEVYAVNEYSFSLRGSIPLDKIPWADPSPNNHNIFSLNTTSRKSSREIKQIFGTIIFPNPKDFIFNLKDFTFRRDKSSLWFQLENIEWSDKYLAQFEEYTLPKKTKNDHLEFIKQYNVVKQNDGTLRIEGNIIDKKIQSFNFENEEFEFDRIRYWLGLSKSQTVRYLNRLIFKDEKVFKWKKPSLKLIKIQGRVRFILDNVEFSENPNDYAEN